MRIGALNRQVRLQRPAGGQDEAGQPTEQWVDVATVWANIRFQSGAEAIRSEVPVSVGRASIRIRWREDVFATMRALQGDRIFDIKAVLSDESGREYVDLVCETGANHG